MHTMNLEDQRLSSKNQKAAFKNMMDETINSPSTLWESKE